MVGKKLVRYGSFFMLIGSAEMLCIKSHDLPEVGRIVLIHLQGFGIQAVLLHVGLQFFESFEVFEVGKGLGSAAKLVIDLEPPAK
jgi:hypothetical protein